MLVATPSLSPPLWMTLAYLDLMARFRRSWLGALWLVVTPTIFIASVSVVYATLFGADLASYVPSLALGYVCWTLLAACVAEGPVAVVESDVLAKNLPDTPISTWMLRVVARQIMTVLSPFVVALVAVVVCGKLSVWHIPLGLIGLALLFAVCAGLVVILAIIGTRYRDVQPITANIMQVAFLVTPVMWQPSMLGSRQWIVAINPLASILSVARDPWLGVVPAADTYIVASASLLALTVIAVTLYGRYRHRVVYWL